MNLGDFSGFSDLIDVPGDVGSSQCLGARKWLRCNMLKRRLFSRFSQR